MLAELEWQGQERGRRVHIDERARYLDRISMMSIRKICCQLIFLAESRYAVAY